MDEDGPAAEPIGTTWLAVSWLMISDIVGTSVLTFAGVAYELGWVLSVVLILGLFPLSLFISVLMCRTRELLLSNARMRGKAVPRVDTMGAIAAASFQKGWAGPLVYLAVYGYTMFGQGSYLLVMGTSLQQTFYIDPASPDFGNMAMCLPWALLYCCLCLMIPICVVRRLGESIWICLVNTFLIVLVLVIALTDLYLYGSRIETKTHAFAPGLGLSQVMGATTNVVYAYAGQWMYFEIMETMRKPADFPWAFAVAGPFMVSSYLAVALLGYFFGAGREELLASMSLGSPLRVAAGLLFAHVLIVYLIKNVVLVRYFHSKWRPANVESRSCQSYLQYGAISIGILVLGYFVANSVPFFNQLLGVLGGLCAGPINFFLPILFYLVTLGRKLQHMAVQQQTARSEEADGAASPQTIGAQEAQTSGEVAEDVNLIGANIEMAAASALPEEAPLYALCWLGFRALRRAELILVLIVSILIFLTMCLGVYENLKEIVELTDAMGAPFSCHEFNVTAM